MKKKKKQGNKLIFCGILLSIASLILFSFEAGHIVGIQEKVNQLNADREIKMIYKINFSDGLIKDLNHLYANTLDDEFAVCLKGSIDNNNVILLKGYSQFVRGNRTAVVNLDCNRAEEVAHLHKHSNGGWKPSHADVAVMFKDFKQLNNKVAAIMYGENKFNVFTEANWDIGKRIEYE